MNTANEMAIQCTVDWPDDFRMSDFCENQQLESISDYGGADEPPRELARGVLRTHE